MRCNLIANMQMIIYQEKVQNQLITSKHLFLSETLNGENRFFK